MRLPLMLLFLVGLGIAGCDSKPIQEQPKKAQAATVPDKFNVADKSVTTNNNLLVAVEKLRGESVDSFYPKAEKTDAAILTKSPYSSIGKIVKITGKIYKVEEIPPSPEFKGKWGEVLMFVDNRNSALGATTVDYLHEGDISKINPGQIVTCFGYFIGTHDSPNAMGGMVESVVLVGNKVVLKSSD